MSLISVLAATHSQFEFGSEHDVTSCFGSLAQETISCSFHFKSGARADWRKRRDDASEHTSDETTLTECELERRRGPGARSTLNWPLSEFGIRPGLNSFTLKGLNVPCEGNAALILRNNNNNNNSDLSS